MKNLEFYRPGGRFVFGMVHCKPLPGTARFGGDMEEIYDLALRDAAALEAAGVAAMIVENMGDDPFGERLDAPQAAALAAVSARVAEAVSIPIGVDAAMNDYAAALSIAKAVGAEFVRVPVFVDTVVYSGGIIEPCAREAVMLRRNLDAGNIKILADIHVKHTHMLLPHMSIEDSAKMAQGAGADGLIVTGTHIGTETPIELIQRVKAVSSLPVIVGSGFKEENARAQLQVADGAIVGSSIKEGGVFTNPVSEAQTRALMQAARG
ncbi:MAG: BtpA/SgcQ family protein, partial [Clostridiales bacterium]|nr:BtpA/SgcQ family protein [Clostridiales bacterium]